jgi:fibronectin-binding autotransporter adhesin
MKVRLAIRMVTTLLFLVSVGGLRSRAQTAVSWTGTSSGNWNTASDWSGGVVPNNGGSKTYNVTISPGTTQSVDLNLGVTVTDLTLGAASGSDVTLQSVAGDSLTIANGGNLTVDSTGTLLFKTTGSDITVGSGGTLTNNGTLDLEAAGETLKVTGATTNAPGATLFIEGGSAATFTGNVTNSGTFETGFSGGSNTVTVTGTFTNDAGATLMLRGSGDVVNINALSNFGTLTLDAGTTLTLTGGGNGLTDAAAGTTYNVGGAFNVKNGTTTTSALAKLTSVEGTLTLQNGKTNTVTPTGGTLTIASTGAIEVSFVDGTNTTLSITGNVNNSGKFTTGFTAGGTNTVNVSGTLTNAAGGNVDVYSSTDVVNVKALGNSGTLQIGSAVGSKATVNITGGGKGVTDVVVGSAILLYGDLNVVNSGTATSALANLTTVAGNLYLMNDQTTSVTPSGGTLTIASTGNLGLSNNAASTTTLSIAGSVSNSGSFATGVSGGTNTVTVSGTFTNNSGAFLQLFAGNGSGGTDLVNIATLSNAGTVTLYEPGATLDITGTGTLTNSGTINLTQGTLKFNSSTATLTGGGTVLLGNSAGSETGVIKVGSSDTGTLTNTNNTITGYGNLGNGTLTLVNKGKINANGQASSGALTIQPGSGAMANSGTIEATNQGTLILEGTYNNTGGTIEALGESGGTVNATVQLKAGTVINGGTLTTTTVGSNNGVIEGTGAVTLSGVTNSGTYAVNAGTTTTLKGTITNSGSITLTGSTLSLGNSVTLNGAGKVILSNSASNLITGATSGLTLTNANTIEGGGTISNLGIVNTGTIAANQSTPLIILPSSSHLNNTGTLSVSAGDTMEIGTSTGGALSNLSGTTLTGGTYSVSGTLEFGASGTSVVTDAANISLTGVGAKIVDFASQNVLTDLATITSAGTFTLSGGAAFITVGNFTNDGALTVNSGSKFTVVSSGSLTNFSSSTDTLAGGTYTVGGTLLFAGANIVTDAANITLDGTGEIENSTTSKSGLANLATITSAGSFTLGNQANFTTAGNLTDNGKLTVNSGSTLTVTGDLTNFNSSTKTLASGTYTVGGTLEFTGANIVTNAANLTITGTTAKILNGTTNGLANFANNTGTFAVTGNGTFTTGPADFTDSGAVTVATGSTMTVGGGDTYTQSAGTTTVDGTLSASAINVTGGKILGAGKLTSSVTVGGGGTAPTISAGDSGKAGLLAITGSYTELSTATMNAFIGGATVGTQYSQLQVGSTASLAGTLTVTLASGFTPAIGSTFTVLKAGTVTGTFSNSTIAINTSEHFAVSYTSTGVVLTVVSGAASKSGGLPRPSVAAAVPAKGRPVLISGLRHGIGGTPRSSNHIIATGTENIRARSDAILARGFGFSRFEVPNRLPVPVAIWDHLPPVASPVVQSPRGPERVSESARSSHNWNEPARGISVPPMPVPETFTRRTPARIQPPILPRLGR